MCQHQIRDIQAQLGGFRCPCACHWTCARLGYHRWGGTPDEIDARELICTRCGARQTLIEAN